MDAMMAERRLTDERASTDGSATSACEPRARRSMAARGSRTRARGVCVALAWIVVAGSLGACVTTPPPVPPEPVPVALLPSDLAGERRTVRTSTDDTLVDIARDQGIGYIELMAANPGVDPWLPGEREISLPTERVLPNAPREGVVVNLPEQRLYLFRSGEEVRSYPVGIGREGMKTPIGKTRIVRKAEHPRWYPTASARADDPTLGAVVQPGPDNPLGDHALYLGWPSYLIHGTNKPYGVGRRVSRGCLRMYPEDVAELFALVGKGTPVRVLNQPIKLGRGPRGELFIQAHPSLDQALEIDEGGKLETVDTPDLRPTITEWAGVRAGEVDWEKVRVALVERTGLPVQISAVSAAPETRPDPFRRLADMLTQWVSAAAHP